MSCIAPSRDFFRGAPPPEKHFFIRAPETDPAVLIAGPIAVHRSPSDRRVATDDGPERSRCSFPRGDLARHPPRAPRRDDGGRGAPRATWRTSRSSPGTSSTRSSRSSATRTGALCFTPPRRRVRVRVRLPRAPASPPIPPAPPGPQDARLTPDAPASSPAPPSRTAAGKTELVELFLGTPAGRALVNVGDEVRDAAPRVGRLDERVGVPTSFFLAAAADPTSRERPAPFPPSFLTPRRPARSDPARSDPARVRRPTGLRFTPRAAPATSSACASSSPRARTPTARTRAGRGARTTPPAKAASTRSSR